MNRIPNIGILHGLMLEAADEDRLIAEVEKRLVGETKEEALARLIREGVGQFSNCAKQLNDFLTDLLTKALPPLQLPKVEVTQDLKDPSLMHVSMELPNPMNYIIREITI